jgi:hypothetical protein
MPSYQYIFTMQDLRKVVPPSREVLKGIYLSFFPGAKIGVLGANGAGRAPCSVSWPGWTTISSARPGPRRNPDWVPPQEPGLDPAKDVRGNVETAIQPIRDLLTSSRR